MSRLICCLFACLPAGLGLVPLAAVEVTELAIAYDHDGTALEGVLYLPENASDDAPVPGVLVVHEWWGHNAYARQRARELAVSGYAAFACDMYGTEPVDTPAEAQELATPFYQDRSLMRARAQAGLDQLAEHPQVDAERLAAIGFCFGGTVALALARSGADLDAVVSFHGGLGTPDRAAAGDISGRVLVCHGGADPLVPHAELTGFIDEMEGAGVDYRIEIYGGAKHAFTNPAADDRDMDPVAYDPDAEAASMVAMLGLFGEVFTD